jgi:hypothetical protein
MAMMGMGAATSVVGAYNSASMQKDSLGFQANIADINSRMAEQSAQTELQRGEREYQSSRLRTGQLKGRQRASLAANGVDLGVGSAAEILTSTDVMGEIDANTIQANAIRQAWGYRTQATGYQNDALIKRASASSINPGMAAVSTLLTEGAKMGSTFVSMNKGLPSWDDMRADISSDPIASLNARRGWTK